MDKATTTQFSLRTRPRHKEETLSVSNRKREEGEREKEQQKKRKKTGVTLLSMLAAFGCFAVVLFGSLTLIFDNNRSEKELVTLTLNTASKFIRGQLRSTPQNLTAKQWIANELQAKKRI